MATSAPESELSSAVRPSARGTHLRRLRRESPSLSLTLLPFVVLVVDLLIVTSTMFLAVLGRHRLAIFSRPSLEFAPALLAAAPVIAVGWVVAIAALGGYERRALGAGTDEYRRVVNASFLTAAVTGIGCYMLRLDLARGFYVLAVMLGPALLLLGRWCLRKLVQRARARGSMLHRVLIVGSETHIDEVAAVLSRESWLGYDVIGALTPGHVLTPATASGVPVIGSASGLVSVANNVKADVAFFVGGAVDSAAELREIAWKLEHSACQVVVAPSLTDVSHERISVRPVGGLPLLHLEKPRAAAAAHRAKRTFDAVSSLVMLLLVGPLLMLAAFEVWRHDRGPVFFKQQRIGRDGKAFGCWKFRTMVTNAEDLLADLHVQQGYQGGLFKMECDPRITRPGRWMRRFSIDELPQLVNVLKGEMSMVGPRPPLEHEVAQYDETMARRLRVRPGVTGLWQVSGRSSLSWSEAIRLDLYYVDNWSMMQDLAILVRTVGVVFRSRGAY